MVTEDRTDSPGRPGLLHGPAHTPALLPSHRHRQIDEMETRSVLSSAQIPGASRVTVAHQYRRKYSLESGQLGAAQLAGLVARFSLEEGRRSMGGGVGGW